MYFLRSTYPAHSTDSGSAGSESIIECQIRSNHLLKLVNLAEIFTGNSVYILEWIFVGLSYSRAILGISVPGRNFRGWSAPPLLRGDIHIRNFSSVGGAGLPPPPPPPMGGDIRYILHVDNIQPIYRFRECRLECQIRSNHLLKLVNLAEIFTGNSVYILEWIFVGLSYSRTILGISVPGVGLVCLPPPPPPPWGEISDIS